MGVSKLTGTPWHVEQMRIGEEDSRRHKSRCVYYNKKTGRCSKMVDKCIGSTYCDHYKEGPLRIKKQAEQEQISEMMAEHKAEIARKKKEDIQQHKQPEINYCEEYPVGSRVIHNKLGKGIVKDHNGGKITVQFADGKETRLDPKTCFEKGNLLTI